MYDFVDRPAACLTEGSRFLLWSMRGWVQTATQGGCPTVALAPAFSKMGMLDILGEFHLLMLGLQHDGIHEMAFGTVSQPVISESEAVLLAFWRDAAAGRSERVGALLALLLHPGSIEACRLSAIRIAAYLATEGLAPAGLVRPADVSTPRR